MRKRFLAICSVLIAAIVLVAMVPGCDGGATTGTIDVDATLDGSPWSGAVEYTLTGPGAAAPTIINGSSVPNSHTAEAGDWTCAYLSGGPPDTNFVDITPSASRSLSAGGTIGFTLNFETPPPLDASVTFVSWTIDGQQVPPGQYTVYPPTIIDCEYDVVVNGTYCESVNVTVSFKLEKHFKGPGESQSWHVANAPGSVSLIPPGTILSQNASVNGVVHPICYTFDVFNCVPMYYDVTIKFEAHKGTSYRMKINWLGYRKSEPEDILFDTDAAHAGDSGSSDLVTSGCVHVEGDVDPTNDCSGNSSTLYITYDFVGPPPG